MTSQVTQCPKCHTSFRVTETQLHIANGAVRCGSCLHIFDAPDHWLDTGTYAQVFTPPEEEQEKSENTNEEQLDTVTVDTEETPFSEKDTPSTEALLPEEAEPTVIITESDNSTHISDDVIDAKETQHVEHADLNETLSSLDPVTSDETEDTNEDDIEDKNKETDETASDLSQSEYNAASEEFNPTVQIPAISETLDIGITTNFNNTTTADTSEDLNATTQFQAISEELIQSALQSQDLDVTTEIETISDETIKTESSIEDLSEDLNDTDETTEPANLSAISTHDSLDLTESDVTQEISAITESLAAFEDENATVEIRALSDIDITDPEDNTDKQDPNATTELEAITEDINTDITPSAEDLDTTREIETISEDLHATMEMPAFSEDPDATREITAISEDLSTLPDVDTDDDQEFEIEGLETIEEQESNKAEDFDEDALFHDTMEQPTLGHIEIKEDDTLDHIFDDKEHYLIDDTIHLAFDDDDQVNESEELTEASDSPAASSSASNQPQPFDDDDAIFDDNTPLYGDTGSYPQTKEPVKENLIVNEGMISAEDLDLPLENDDSNETGEFSNTFLEMDNWEEEPASVFKELDDLGGVGQANEEEWAEKLLEDEDVVGEEPLVEEPEPFEEMPEIFESVEDEGFDSQEFEPDLDLPDEEELAGNLPPVSEDEFVLSNEPMMAGERISKTEKSMTSSQVLLANIEPEPLVMSTKLQRSTWKKRAWAASIVIALLGISGQYLFFNFTNLARDKQLRPLLSSTCNFVGCTLPALDDVRQILSSNLMVRSHPEVDDALVVDAIITNRAKFKQQFPVMELQFTDLSGNIVAGRRFMPEEYLAGELTGASLMPTRQPIHISLEIVDPGQDAVNYQLYFYPQRGG